MVPAIRVDGLAKRYRIRPTDKTAQYRTLREDLMRLVAAPVRLLRTGIKNRSDDFWALQDVSFEIQPGEVVGIIGRNGAGKSTLLKILSRITRPTSGYAQLRGRVGSLLEVGTGFHLELTGRENIYLSGAILGMKRQEIHRRFDEIVAFAEIEQFLDTPVKHYSTGMYVRLGFAVAAHLEPEILIVDEVLAVGDASFQKKCLGKINDVSRTGRTVLLVSHNMTAVKMLCSRALFFRRGRLIADGNADAIVAEHLVQAEAAAVERTWDSTDEAPGNSACRLRRVAVCTADGVTATESLTSQTPLTIEIDYEVLRRGACIGTTIVLHNPEGACILSAINNRDPQWHGVPRQPGIYRSICRLPQGLFSPGQINVSTILWESHYQLVHQEPDVVQFMIEEDATMRGDYTGGWSGVIRPDLGWQTSRLRWSQEMLSDMPDSTP